MMMVSRLLVGSFLILLFTGSVHAGAPDNLAQAELGEQQLQASTKKITSQLDELIQEFDRNGIARDDRQALKTLAATLTELTDQEMQRVIDLLHAGQATAAYASQTIILEKLRQLAVNSQSRQQQQEIAGKIAALGRAIEEQLKMANETKALTGDGEAKGRIDQQQAALLATTDALRKDAEKLALAAESKLQDARDDMQTARAELQSKTPARAELAQRQAVEKMTQARQAFAEQLAELANATPMPGTTTKQEATSSSGATSPGSSLPSGLGPPGNAANNGIAASQTGIGAIDPMSNQSGLINLPARDRETIQQSEGEKYPAEYRQMIEQYWKNLADQSTPSQ